MYGRHLARWLREKFVSSAYPVEEVIRDELHRVKVEGALLHVGWDGTVKPNPLPSSAGTTAGFAVWGTPPVSNDRYHL
jgi:hypothetical protein